jgi:hypothetical protein
MNNKDSFLRMTTECLGIIVLALASEFIAAGLIAGMIALALGKLSL